MWILIYWPYLAKYLNIHKIKRCLHLTLQTWGPYFNMWSEHVINLSDLRCRSYHILSTWTQCNCKGLISKNTRQELQMHRESAAAASLKVEVTARNAGRLQKPKTSGNRLFPRTFMRNTTLAGYGAESF